MLVRSVLVLLLLANALDVSGTGNFTGTVNVATPTAAGMAATKAYVDTAIASVTSTISGTIGYDARFTGANSVGTGLIYETSTNVGIGTTTPGNKLEVNGGLTTDSGISYINNNNGNESIDTAGIRGANNSVQQVNLYDRLSIGYPSGWGAFPNAPAEGLYTYGGAVLAGNSGNVGIGQTSPGYKLDVSGTGNFTGTVNVATPTTGTNAATKAYVDTAVTGGGTGGSFSTINVTGNWTLSGAAQSSLNMNGNSITGLNKLTVTTIDPVYDIGGAKYATYGPESVGITVTSDGKANCAESNSAQPKGCAYTLDFAGAAKGSDLWLFWQTIDAGQNLQNVSLILTPEGGEASLWYDIVGNTIVVHGNHPVAFSYHLSAPRYDSSKWGNTLVNSIEPGVILQEK